MKTMDVLKKWSTPRNLLLSLIATVVIISMLNYYLQVLVYDVYGNYIMPDTRFCYTFEEIQAVFDGLGSQGLQVWSTVHLLDYFFPLVYMLAMVFAIGLELKKLNIFERYDKVLLLPILGCIADYTENILVQSQVFAFPNISAIVINVASYVTLIKWAFLTLGFVVIILLILLIIYQRISKANE